MARSPAGIGKAEMRVLEYVQQNGPLSVRQAAEHFAASEGVARTTVLNVLVRLWRKGHLTRRRQPDGSHLYAAREERVRLLRRLVGEFIGDVLGGNVSPFVAYLAEQAIDLPEADRRQLTTLLRQLKQRDRK